LGAGLGEAARGEEAFTAKGGFDDRGRFASPAGFDNQNSRYDFLMFLQYYFIYSYDFSFIKI